MIWSIPPQHPLRKLFSGVTEQAFISELGVAEPSIVDYLSELLARFIHSDELHRLRRADGTPITDVAMMFLQAASLPAEGRTKREYLRHIGDYALFRTGVFPESVEQERKRLGDSFISMTMQGKQSYHLASLSEQEDQGDAELLHHLSESFEMCAYGLNRVRKELDQIANEKRFDKLYFG